MCTVCGCGTATIEGKDHDHGEHGHHHHDHAHDHSHDHDHDHGHAHGHHHHGAHGDLHFGTGAAGTAVAGVSQARLLEIETDILSKNDAYADGNRRVLRALGTFAVNLVSSPGSGKTTLLCKTIEMLGDQPLAVIEGDQQTSNDADRIRATGAKAIQVNTGKGCHLDGHMVGHAMDHLNLPRGAMLFIENVGNLVCPAGFDLGEDAKVAILSVTEGEDKPLKYPDMFTVSKLAILNKIDLAPHCDVDLDAYEDNLRRVNPHIEILRVSARTGEGMDHWVDWLRAHLADKSAGAAV
ncbi:[NiFe] hydrogenase nickel incorporation-associated protein HypB [Rhodovulum sp. P5]|uniref:hydrogenase nickel incorporation protein HypB n=1 Tax=Rhodovulum sp. P5 TaxID=1564506 RepID=UPI0009C1DEBC|nr:hydrogenase nickel incorporation protein HypB [Rhodovulum sp. P5]ARE40689.1 [NiFe] hydrogenase nickel incorporation-associated protein HypB [Rhodovulum sp. P5]